MRFEYREIPADMKAQCDEYRAKLVEAAAEGNEGLLNKYLESNDALDRGDHEGPARARDPERDLHRHLRLGLQEQGRAGRARRGHRLHAVADRGAGRQGPDRGRRGDDAPADRRGAVLRARVQDPERPVRRQPDVLPRLFRARCSSGDQVYVPNRSRKERIGRLLQMHASEREEIKEVRAGDIAAAVGLKDVTTGDTLSDPDDVIVLEKMEFPDAGDLGRRRAEDQGRPGKDGHRAAAPGQGRPVVPRARPTRSRARPSSPAWASCTSRSSSTA